MTRCTHHFIYVVLCDQTCLPNLVSSGHPASTRAPCLGHNLAKLSLQSVELKGNPNQASAIHRLIRFFPPIFSHTLFSNFPAFRKVYVYNSCSQPKPFLSSPAHREAFPRALRAASPPSPPFGAQYEGGAQGPQRRSVRC